MSDILYIKFDKNISTYNQTVTIGEAGEMQCSSPEIVSRLRTVKLFTFHNIKKGRRTCAARQVCSILEVIQKIHEVYPNLEVQNLGEQDFIVELSTKHQEHAAFTFVKVALVCLISFFGSAFSIMAFNNDVSTVDLFGQFYTLMTGRQSDGFTILELTYSLGLSVGILAFFNHIGGRRFTKEPTPIEVEMRLYEEDVNTTLIHTASRNASHKKSS